MNEEDLRDCFAMFALVGAMMLPEKRYDAKDIWRIADDMVESRKAKDEAGIASVKRTRKPK